MLNTDEGNSGGLWANHVCPAGGWIYVQLRGRHTSAILRTPLPAKPLYAPDSADFPKVSAQLKLMGGMLGGAKVIVDEMGDMSGFCATEVAGSPRVFFCTRSGQGEGKAAMMLWDGAGAPTAIGHIPVE